MAVLPTRRNVQNLTPWPLSQQASGQGADSFGWMFSGVKQPVFIDSNKVKFEALAGGGANNISSLKARIYNVKSGRTYATRMTVSNKTGTFGGITMMADTGKVSSQTMRTDVVNGEFCMTFTCNANYASIEIWIGIGIFAGENNACSYEATNVSTQQLPSGLSVPMEYHNHMEEWNRWNHDADRYYGGDKTRIAYSRSGDVSVSGAGVITESYGTSTIAEDDDVIVFFGDSITDYADSFVGRINQNRDDIAMYGETIGGYSMQQMDSELIRDRRQIGSQHGGLNATRMIMQRVVNDIFLYPAQGRISGVAALAVAKDLMLSAFRLGMPVMFFTCSPFEGFIHYSAPDDKAEALYYNSNLLTYLQAAAVAAGYSASNVFVYDVASLVDDPARPGQFYLRPAWALPDGLHYNTTGDAAVYNDFVGGGYLDAFIAHDFVGKSAPAGYYQPDFPKRIPFRKVS